MYVGLTLTYASVFQMLRGSVVIFTGILSVLFLGRKLYAFHWLGMLLILVGLLVVGLSSLGGDDDANAPNPILGDILIVGAQLVVAIQMVVEERAVKKYNVPALQVVGYEGMFGATAISVILLIFYYVPGDQVVCDCFENTPDAIIQTMNSWIIAACLLGTVVSIAFFNWFGISVTKDISATTRMVLDSVRTFLIWAISLAVGWQEFSYLQIVGFVLLLLGTAIYNEILRLPFLPSPPEDQGAALVEELYSGNFLPSELDPELEGDSAAFEPPVEYRYGNVQGSVNSGNNRDRRSDMLIM